MLLNINLEIYVMTIIYFIVLDATGKLPDGMLVGHQKLMGNMDECLDIEVFKPHFDGEILESFRYTNIISTQTCQ